MKKFLKKNIFIHYDLKKKTKTRDNTEFFRKDWGDGDINSANAHSV